MKSQDFYDLFGEKTAVEDLAMVQDVDTGKIFTIKDVEREHHEDGSTTAWIKVEEI